MASSFDQAAQAPRSAKQHWTLWEADILVACGLKHQFVTVFEPDSGQLMQSFIHGFDLDNSLLLLDGLYPVLQKRLPPNSTFWLQIRCEYGFFNLKVALIEIEEHSKGEWITVKVLSSALSHNRRWQSRVFFEPRQGPRVDLQLDNQPLQQAYVVNLSRKGAQVDLYGTNLSLGLIRKRSLHGHFFFNDRFQLRLDATIRQSRFLRKPCCHTQLRILFNRLNDQQQMLLDSFIDTLGTSPNDTYPVSSLLSPAAMA